VDSNHLPPLWFVVSAVLNVGNECRSRRYRVRITAICVARIRAGRARGDHVVLEPARHALRIAAGYRLDVVHTWSEPVQSPR
jgi:hypothetical protein